MGTSSRRSRSGGIVQDEGIQTVIQVLTQALRRQCTRPPLHFSPELLQACACYPRPENLRELGDLVKRRLVLEDEKTPATNEQPCRQGPCVQFDSAAPRQQPGTGRQSEDEAEAEAITTALAGLESQAGPGLAVDQLQGPAVENP